MTRVRVVVRGVVQGVGFRPFVHALAHRHALGGAVHNRPGGVSIEVEGPPEAVAAFTTALVEHPPPRARIDDVEETLLSPRGQRSFVVAASDAARNELTIASDAAVCDGCMSELFDPGDRRYRYPLISCLACGPRYSVVTETPWDRERTSLSAWAMCDDCRREHDDPASRRFYAQTTLCPSCGPALTFRSHDEATSHRAFERAADALRAGAVVAVKSMGGYHLAVSAHVDGAVERLREQKQRPDKPLALLVADVDAARAIVELDDAEIAVLAGPVRPVLLARRRTREMEAVAPGSHLFGVMLPATALQHLLARELATPLVMTSANVSGQPMTWRREGEAALLAEVADAVLTHDVELTGRSDDSVMRRVGGTITVLRGGRGLTPAVTRLPSPLARPTLAVGAQMKTSIALGAGDRVLSSPHVGDLSDYATFEEWCSLVARLEALDGVSASRWAHDCHPGYTSTRYAQERGVELVVVQHHHAHFAACLADNAHRGPALGVVFDGTGYGSDGTVWGGELFLGDAVRVERIGHLLPVPLPTGAIREPWRMAFAYRLAAGLPPGEGRHVAGCAKSEIDAVASVAGAGTLSSSVGRLFDAVAAMLGESPRRVSFEAQAAMRLETLAAEVTSDGAYAFTVEDGILDPSPAIRAIDDDVAGGLDVRRIARRFHEGLADATASACVLASRASGVRTVALSGGVMVNDVLVASLKSRLAEAGLTVLVHRDVSPGDGGIALGQLAVVAARDGVG